MKHLTLSLLLAAPLLSQGWTAMPNTGSWIGPVNSHQPCEFGTPCRRDYTVLSKPPAIGSSPLFWTNDFGHPITGCVTTCADPGSYLCVLMIGAERMNFALGIGTGTTPAIVIPFPHAIQSTFQWPFGRASYLDIPNEPGLVGIRIWAQFAHLWQQQGSPRMLFALASQFDILPPSPP